MAADMFRSARLLYRAAEAADDDFFYTLWTDSEAEAQTTVRLLRPQSRKNAEEFRKWEAEKTLLGVVICIAPPPTTTTAAVTTGTMTTTTATGDASIPSPPKPIPIGTMHLTKIPENQAHHRRADIGISILAPYRGQGYGTEAIKWILGWGFWYAALHRISIGCFSFNDGARRLYERLGFVTEGRQREALWYAGGWHDFVDMGMLEHEWREKYGKGEEGE